MLEVLRSEWREICAAWSAGNVVRDPYYCYATGHITFNEYCVLVQYPEPCPEIL